ncbi:MAG: hypothetical protein M3Q76_02840, partial [Acidobacteriota bacterium]|nr:hypothetical protein [Acidobacteriota bacterium]
VAMTFWGRERFLDVPAGGQADEAHAHGYAEHAKPHDAVTEAAGDRPRHEPGEYVGEPHAAGLHTHQTTPGAHALHEAPHGHGTHIPHESPPAMWIPLAVLAVLAVVGGLVGISQAFTGGAHVGGRANIVNWLDPVIWNPATGEFNKPHGAEAEHAAARPDAGFIASTSPATAAAVAASPAAETHGAATATTGETAHAATGTNAAAHGPYGDTGFNLAHSAEHALGSHTAAEWLFIIISLVAAGIGIGLGYLFYVKQPHLPGVWAARMGALYRASYNKYWIDELYGLLFTRRTMDAARGIYAVDSRSIDGAVNGVAWLTRRLSSFTGVFDNRVIDGIVNLVAYFIRGLMSNVFRAAQTGFAANYALVMIVGLFVALVLFFVPDLWAAVRGK